VRIEDRINTLIQLDTEMIVKSAKHKIRDQWRQREFKVGGDEAPKGMSPFPPDPGEGSGRGNFFVISKWQILVTLRC